MSTQPPFKIPFNKPFLTGHETKYIENAVRSGKISGNGEFTRKCHHFFSERYNFRRSLLTSSCTDALEMAAILLKIGPGDEVIIPSYTFVSTANAFILRGARIVFADSEDLTPNIDAKKIEALVSPKTKVIVVVHYAGVSCNMSAILDIANRHNLFIVEDAAHAIEANFNKSPLGGLGHLATFSFHETKNVISGEGGLLVINDKNLWERAQIVWEKGTNRVAFQRGEIAKYNWVDIGSSFLPSEITAAFLFAQLENIELIQSRRVSIWQSYLDKLKPLANRGQLQLPFIPEYASINGHLFYMIAENINERDRLIAFLQTKGILAVFHYLPLHESPYFRGLHDGRDLPNCTKFRDRLLRLPLYFELTEAQVDYICENIIDFYE